MTEQRAQKVPVAGRPLVMMSLAILFLVIGVVFFFMAGTTEAALLILSGAVLYAGAEISRAIQFSRSR